MGERRRANAGERCRPQSFFTGVVAIAGECCNISFHVKNAKLCELRKSTVRNAQPAMMKAMTAVGICMVLEQSIVEVCLKGLNGVSMCPVVWKWCINACEKSLRWCLHVCENMSVRMMV